MSAVEVSYRVEGQGPALYMVHGIGSRQTTWDEMVEGLKDRFTCVTYDLRVMEKALSRQLLTALRTWLTTWKHCAKNSDTKKFMS